MDENAVDIMAFVIHNGFIKFTRMPFGLMNAPATFQRAMDVILVTVKWHFTIVYINGIIFFKTPKQNLEHLGEVMRLLKNAGVTIKLKQCIF